MSERLTGNDSPVLAAEARLVLCQGWKLGYSFLAYGKRLLIPLSCSNRIGTPLFYKGRIYFFLGGVANCVDAEAGQRVFQARLEGGSARPQNRGRGSGGRGRRGGRGGGFGGDYSSSVVAEGKLYFVSRSGEAFVVNAGDEFEQLAVNRMTDEREDFSATPSVSDGELFLRSSKHLYCVSLED